MGFTIDEVTDIDAVWADLEMLSLGIIEYHRPWDDRPLRDDWALRMREFLKVGPHDLTLIARDESGAALAFVTGNVSSDYGIFEETFSFINNFYVLPEARAQSVGTTMLQRFEEWAVRCGATTLRLHVNVGNDIGKRFWDRCGFVPTEQVMVRPLGPVRA